MKTVEKPLGSAFVDEVGRRLRDRRVRMGISARQLADEADVDRGRLAKLEAGDTNVRPTTVGKIEAALARLEQEMGMDDVQPEASPSVEQIEFVVEGDFGVKVTVRGPITDRAQLRADVAEIVRSIRQEQEPD